MTDGLNWRIEEICINACPSLRQVTIGSWLIRIAEGVTRRANSVNPLPGFDSRLAPVIEAARRIYHAHGLDILFRVPSFIDPAIDRRLDLEGFAEEGDNRVLFGDLGAYEAGPEVVIEPSASDAWLDAITVLNGRKRDVFAAMTRSIALPAGFASLIFDGRPVSMAYGVVEGGVLCYEAVITDPQYRGRGHALRVIEAIAAWAKMLGADCACLQVESENAPAIALYRRFGLARETHRYHYRRSLSGSPLTRG